MKKPNKESIRWTDIKSYHNEKIGVYRGVIVEKTRHFYYVKWTEHVDWAVPHSKMSDGMRSAQATKKFIDRLLERESQDQTMIVFRLNPLERQLLWAKRGYKRGA